jgi:hypothetical protein
MRGQQEEEEEEEEEDSSPGNVHAEMWRSMLRPYAEGIEIQND